MGGSICCGSSALGWCTPAKQLACLLSALPLPLPLPLQETHTLLGQATHPIPSHPRLLFPSRYWLKIDLLKPGCATMIIRKTHMAQTMTHRMRSHAHAVGVARLLHSNPGCTNSTTAPHAASLVCCRKFWVFCAACGKRIRCSLRFLIDRLNESAPFGYCECSKHSYAHSHSPIC